MANEKKALKKKAEVLRANMPEGETRIWEAIRNSKLGVKFRRQQARYGRLLDFYCDELRLALAVVDDSNRAPEAFPAATNITILLISSAVGDLEKNIETIQKMITELQAAGVKDEPSLTLIEGE